MQFLFIKNKTIEIHRSLPEMSDFENLFDKNEFQQNKKTRSSSDHFVFKKLLPPVDPSKFGQMSNLEQNNSLDVLKMQTIQLQHQSPIFRLPLIIQSQSLGQIRFNQNHKINFVIINHL